MLIKYTIAVNNKKEDQISEIGEFKNMYWNPEYKSLVIKLKTLMPIYLPMKPHEANSFTEDLFKKIKEKEEIIEINGTVFNVSEYSDEPNLLKPEELFDLKDACHTYGKYEITG